MCVCRARLTHGVDRKRFFCSREIDPECSSMCVFRARLTHGVDRKRIFRSGAFPFEQIFLFSIRADFPFFKCISYGANCQKLLDGRYSVVNNWPTSSLIALLRQYHPHLFIMKDRLSSSYFKSSAPHVLMIASVVFRVLNFLITKTGYIFPQPAV